MSKKNPPSPPLSRRTKARVHWDKPITSLGARARAWLNLLIVDHGFLRLFHRNLHRVSPDLWRSAQPSPRDIKRFAQKGGRTIINLRGGKNHGAWQLEREAAQHCGIKIVDVVMRSRELPSRELILRLPDLFRSIEYPALAHCKAGADRAGIFSALYLLIVEKTTSHRALQELSLSKGHFRYSKSGILDALILAYAEEGEMKGKSFLDWVKHDYAPETLKENFKPGKISNFINDAILHRE